MMLDLAPPVEVDGTEWRFMAIQSKNRAEWVTVHLANMYCRCTTVALYDTLGQDATRFILDQTELTSVACSVDLIERMVDLKLKDQGLPKPDIKMHRLRNIISFDKVLDTAVIDKAKDAGINVYTFADVIQKGY
jgi:long-chain acyl-CoA synthetase